MLKVPFLDLRIQHSAMRDQVQTAISEVLDAGWFVLGRQGELFEREFAAYCGTSEAVGVGSGTEALHLALEACGIGPGDEVITVAHSFVATALAISWTGAQPVFVDIDPDTCTIDVDQVAAAVTERTKAIIPVHLYGQCADMDPLLALAQRYGLWVIEDAAQAHGAQYKGRAAGSLGHLGCFSFYPTKNLGACGDAGAIVSSDPALVERLRLLRNYGQVHKYHHASRGYNSRLDELQAAILRVKLRYVAQWNADRQALAALYDEMLAGCIKIPHVRPGSTHVYHLYVVQSEWRDSLQKSLQSQGIGTLIHYPVPIHEQEAYKGTDSMRCVGPLSVTQQVSRRVLSLPMYPELTTDQVSWVAHAIVENLSQEAGA